MANVKKELTINFSAKSIELAESFEKKASIYGSTEYIMLQNARKDFPNYRIEVIKKTKKAKDCHKGLTAKFMYKYIKNHDNEKREVMNLFKEYFETFDEEKEKFVFYHDVDFFKVQKWFLSQYTEIDEAIKTRKNNLNKTIELPSAAWRRVPI